MKINALLVFIFLVNHSVFSQDQKEQDTTHSVRKAVILSAILPGAGQVYNHLAMPKGQKKAYWKVPLIYAGLGACGYFVYQNNSLQKELKLEYQNRQNQLPGLDLYKNYDDQGILSLYNTHLNRRDLFMLGFGLVYLVQVIDAAVEAHFVTFDISEDLSFSFSPTLVGYQQPGIKLSLNFVK